jgi:hypothetical protein
VVNSGGAATALRQPFFFKRSLQRFVILGAMAEVVDDLCATGDVPYMYMYFTYIFL